MTLPDGCLISFLSPYLEIKELCNLDAVSKDIMSGMADWEGKPFAWLSVSLRAGVNLVGVDKTNIKAVVGAWKQNSIIFPACPIVVLSTKEAQLFVEVTKKVKLKRKHAVLFEGGMRVSRPFVIRFRFDPDDLVAYLDDSNEAIASLPCDLAINIGKHQINLVLTVHKGDLLLSAHAPNKCLCDMFGVHLHSLTPELVMRKDFMASATPRKGSGICTLLQKSEALQATMRRGILCMGLVHAVQSGR